MGQWLRNNAFLKHSMSCSAKIYSKHFVPRGFPHVNINFNRLSGKLNQKKLRCKIKEGQPPTLLFQLLQNLGKTAFFGPSHWPGGHGTCTFSAISLWLIFWTNLPWALIFLGRGLFLFGMQINNAQKLKKHVVICGYGSKPHTPRDPKKPFKEVVIPTEKVP